MRRRTVALISVLAVGLAVIVVVVGRGRTTGDGPTRDGDGPARDPFYARADAERDLRTARTADEEWAAFDRIAGNTHVTFALYDAAGKPLGMSDSDWPNLAHVIRFGQFGEPWLEHTVIDRQNIFTLMRE